ncbi:MAG: ABC transporter substrate-binding protein [Chloroflexi bacterium]|nr:ABC transporter substrate-binding protein [Chloroflexota bacterium]
MMRYRKDTKWLWPGLIFVVVAMVATLIGGQVLAGSARQANTTLTIGYIGQPDSDLARGLQLAINEINAAGGVDDPNNVTYTFELVVAEVPPDDPNAVEGALQSLASAQPVVIFGPDSNSLALPNISALSNAGVPVLTTATSGQLLDGDTANNIFRIVAPQEVYSTALADYLASELGFNQIVVVQVGEQDTEAVTDLNAALNNLNASPIQSIQVADSTQLLANIRTLPDLDPQAVVIYAPPEDVLTLQEQLAASNWDGVLVYPDAQQNLDALRAGGTATEGIVGVTNWTFGVTASPTTQFTTDYVARFGAVPGTHSVAAYDAMYSLSIVISDGGPAPVVIRQLLSQLDELNLVRGPVNPAAYGNRTLSRTAYIYELTGLGGVRALAAYDNGELREGVAVPPISAQPTSTPTPTLTPTPNPTATPSVVTATVTSRVLNLRTGPGTEYERIDQLQQGDQVTVAGRNQNFTWLFIQYQGRVGWVSADFVDLFDPGGLLATVPIVQAPPTPTPQPTQAPQIPDLVITNATITPPLPQPGTVITATVTIENQGAVDAGAFAVATSFLPGEVYAAQNISSLAAGETVTTTLTATITQTGFVPNLAIVVDLNDQVDEGPAGEGNNIYTVSYKVDRAIVAQSQLNVNPGMAVNFYGPNVDMTWDGANITMTPGTARIGPVPADVTYDSAHYGLVSSYATNTSVANPQPGNTFAIITDEGQYGFIRIDGRNGNVLVLTYRIYTP